MADRQTDPTDPERELEGGGAPRSIWISLGFIILSLLALVVVPVYHGERIAALQEELYEVLQPARELSSRLELAQSEQLSSLQAFLLSGDGQFRNRYRRARDREAEVFESLHALSGQLDLSVRERMVRLWSQSARWHVDHLPLVSGEVGPSEFRVLLPDEQRRYDELVSASRDLREMLTREISRAHQRIERARTRQIWMTAGLVGLALAATVTVGFLGRKMAKLFHLGERRRSEAVDARREIDAVLAATGDGVMGIDLEGRCTFLNGAGSELLGVPTRRLMGRHIHELIHHSRPDGSAYPAAECPVLLSLETGRPVRRMDEVLWRPDGTSFPAQLSVRPMVDGLEVKGVVLTFTDLTEIRETEMALRQAVRARDEVVAVVSHDLRNPLATISAASELLQKLDVPRERQREHLEAIGRSAERMGRLIDDLLDVAAIEAGGMAVNMDPVPAETLLDDALQMARPLVRDRAVELKCDADGQLPPVDADRDRILQVFSNLVGNAVRFTPEGGCITLSARRENGEVVWGVEDTGPGIPAEDQEHLFDRFWKVDRSDREGAGLGLAIVKGIVEAHGGSVWVESTPGEGARFHFTLALSASTAVEEATKAGARPV